MRYMRLLGACLIALALTATMVAVAAAHPSEPPAGAIVTPMTITGYDPAVAAKDGVAVPAGATLINTGVAAMLPAGGVRPAASVGGSVTPNGMVYGNCGDSYIYLLSANGDEQLIDRWEGFDVNTSAVAYGYADLIVALTGSWSSPASGYGALALKKSWSNDRYVFAPWAGNYFASADIRAVLWTGAVCESNGPNDEGWFS